MSHNLLNLINVSKKQAASIFRLTILMETASSSKMLVSLYQTMWHHIKKKSLIHCCIQEWWRDIPPYIRDK